MIRGWPYGRGLLFRTDDGAYDGVVVWVLGGSRAPAIATLAELGWPLAHRASRR